MKWIRPVIHPAKQHISNSGSLFYSDLKEDIKPASGDYIDLKSYELGMCNLIDMYINAEHSKKISAPDNFTLVDLIVNKGISALDEVVSDTIKNDKEAMAETIENNIRKVIVEERPGNPKYYDKMSELLNELIRKRQQEAAEYARYLKQLEELARRVKRSEGQQKYPVELKTERQKALYDNLDDDKELAMTVDETIRYNAKDGWREDNPIRERMLRNAVYKALPDTAKVEEVMNIIREHHEH